MKNSTLLYGLITVLLIIITSCKKNQEDRLPADPVQINLTADQSSLIASGNAFAFDMFKKMAAASGTSDNLIISPLSISIALSMTLNGAEGATKDAMLKALRTYGITPEKINESYKNLTQVLLNVDKRVLISIANSVWTENDFGVKKPFSDVLTKYYNADARLFDINNTAAPDEINKWIDDKTNGLIKNMIDKLEDNTVMLLVNAIYFKGKWNSQFDKANTVNETFYKTAGTTTQVPMMKQKSDFKAYVGDGFVMAEFPYGQGNFVMDVILPNQKDGSDNLIQSLDDTSFNNMVSGMGKREIEVSFPRFKYGYKKNLNDILSDMGMAIAFTDQADFSNISDRQLLINKVIHQAFIETNEEGTEAAAATVVDIGLTMAPSPFFFTLDHPFIYIIRETTTNSILFMGKVSDPGVN